MKKDIKSQKNSSYTLTVDDKNYKSEIRNAVKAGLNYYAENLAKGENN